MAGLVAADEKIVPGEHNAMIRFDYNDPFDLEDELGDDERMIRDSARAYAQDRLAPRVAKAFADEYTDPEIFREMGALGLLPEQYGGVGASYVAYGLVAREVERVDSGFMAALGISGGWQIVRQSLRELKGQSEPGIGRGQARNGLRIDSR